MMSLPRPAKAMCMRARPPARHPEPPIACVSRGMITAHVQLLRYSRHSRAHLSRYLRPNQSQMQLRPPPGSGTPSHARPPFHVLSESPYHICRTKLSYDIRHTTSHSAPRPRARVMAYAYKPGLWQNKLATLTAHSSRVHSLRTSRHSRAPHTIPSRSPRARARP